MSHTIPSRWTSTCNLWFFGVGSSAMAVMMGLFVLAAMNRYKPDTTAELALMFAVLAAYGWSLSRFLYASHRGAVAASQYMQFMAALNDDGVATRATSFQLLLTVAGEFATTWWRTVTYQRSLGAVLFARVRNDKGEVLREVRWQCLLPLHAFDTGTITDEPLE